MNFSTLFKFCPVCGSGQFDQHNIKSKMCNSCGFIYYINPSAATAAFIRNDDGDLLVCRRAHEPAKGTLDLPGGFIDYNETAEQGVAREIEEEIGVKAIAVKYLFSLPNDYVYSGMDIPTMDLFFECKLEDYSRIIAADDVEECFFLPVREINPALFGLNSIKKAVGMFIDLHFGKKETFSA
jgi:mutator protein MutT